MSETPQQADPAAAAAAAAQEEQRRQQQQQEEVERQRLAAEEAKTFERCKMHSGSAAWKRAGPRCLTQMFHR